MVYSMAGFVRPMFGEIHSASEMQLAIAKNALRQFAKIKNQIFEKKWLLPALWREASSAVQTAFDLLKTPACPHPTISEVWPRFLKTFDL